MPRAGASCRCIKADDKHALRAGGGKTRADFLDNTVDIVGLRPSATTVLYALAPVSRTRWDGTSGRVRDLSVTRIGLDLLV